MSYNHYLPKGKVSLQPKRHHGFQVVLFILGCLLPPLAVAARFGIGKDFFINCILTICGYIPGHGHNFYIQNIRNNTNKARTPKWAIRYGLVDDSARNRKLAKSQWAKRYDERLPESTLVGQDLAEGEEGANYIPHSEADQRAEERRRNEGLWDRADEEYYNEDDAPNQKRWHYPANFEGTVGDGRRGGRREEPAGDRFERTRRASSLGSSDSSSYGTYPPRAAADDDVPEWGKDYGNKRRNSKKNGRAAPKNDSWDIGYDRGDRIVDTDSYSSGSRQQAPKKSSPDDVFSHEF